MRVTEERTVKAVSDIICDLCDSSCKDEDGYGPHYVTLSGTFGYGSQHDMQYHELHICERCYADLPIRGKVRTYETMMNGRVIGLE